MSRKKKVNHAYLALPLVLTTLFLLMVGFAGVASSSNYITIHIRPNGSIVPSDAPIATSDNITYTVTDDFYGCIIVERSNIALNGDDHIIQSGYSYGIHLDHVNNVTVFNITVTSESTSIMLDGATNCRIVNNTVTESMAGITLDEAENCAILNNTISGNTYGIKLDEAENSVVEYNLITDNSRYGVELYYASDNIVRHNTIADNGVDGIYIRGSSGNTITSNIITRNERYGLYIESSSRNTICNNSFQVDGLYASPGWKYFGNTITNNTVNGKPLVYLENASGALIEDAGQVVLVNCSDISVRNTNLSYTDVGVELWKVSNIIVANNTMTNNPWCGIYVEGSASREVVNTSVGIFNNTIVGCNRGVYIYRASGNTIAGNKISYSGEYGIYLYVASHNAVINNTVSHSHREGIDIYYDSDDVIVAENTVTDCLWYGIAAGSSQRIYVINNSLARNGGVTSGGIVFSGVIDGIIAGNTIVDSVLMSIYIATGSCLIDTNITVFGNTIISSAEYGIYLNAASNITIASNTITGCPEKAIVSLYSRKQMFFNNTIEDANKTGMYVGGCSNVSIFGNTITKSRTGMQLKYCEDITIALNQFTTPKCGVALYSVDNAVIAGNSILSGGFGVNATSSSNITIAYGNIAGNTSAIHMEDVTHCFAIQNHLKSPEGAGIHLKDSGNNTFIMNIIHNSSYGILLNSSSSNIVANNTVANNTVGVNTYNASGNLLYHNNFINNTYQVIVNISTNMWNREYPIGGNYWSDYTGTDEYSGPNQDEPGSDGIGDTPYTIDENNTDHYPLMEPAEIGPPEAFTVTYHLEEGWNLISIPFSEEISVDVFGEDARAYAWNATNRSYHEVELLQPGKGYWLYTPSEREITISSTIILESYQTYSEHGWNLIGATYTPPGSTCQASGDYLYSKAFQWNPEKQRYEAVGLSQLTMGHGYWILVYKANVQITVQTT